MRIELTQPAWKAGVLPLNYTRVKCYLPSYNIKFNKNLWWRGKDSNLRRPEPACLQPAPFDRFGTPPNMARINKNLALINDYNTLKNTVKKHNIMRNNKYWVFGKNPLIELIKKKVNISQVLVTKEKFKSLSSHIPKSINIKIVNKNQIDILNKHKINTQGVAVLINKKEKTTLIDHLNQNVKNKSTYVLLNNISDQRNIGSIIRVCAAFEVNGVIINKKYFNQTNELMIKASAGTSHHIDLIEVSNDANTIKELKKKNYWIYALDGYADNSLDDIKWHDKSVLVVGSEEKGIQELLKKVSDIKIKIPISKNVESLNVSNALSIALYKKNSPS